MAFLEFKEQQCDMVVLECGLGARLDATNVIKCPEVAIVTSIGYDHMERLGNTLPEIAHEKSKVIKPGVKGVVLGPSCWEDPKVCE
jgi:dihydrofolate synthase/folylpolyglutamate synthase